ncbi:hypothetical protein BDV97DRAFT_368360 [Delphinella strobiligena]|nr:hypothetical protein BDV97DRAFT_368360 [Delphinella strobiligena]
MHGLEHIVFMELHVSYKFGRDEASRSAASLGSEVQSISEAARNLRHLRLELVNTFGQYYDADDMLQRRDFLSNFTPPRLPVLHKLDLTCRTSQELLLGFLQTYAGSLRILWLDSCTMSEGSTWQSVIRELPNMLKLEEVYFVDLYKYEEADFFDATFFRHDFGVSEKTRKEVLEHRNQDKAVYDYVLGKSGELPLMKEQCGEPDTL